jgi:cellulose synthase/poly-beta-1,6-N-acetylglucosamine synthase-like glycosyltransferase/peptidoglycan/xylan/chitin deacetylase (PgdA/CDA1 family)/spore germination protein YaaH
MAHPVFFDENGRRARIVNIVLVFVACTCALLLVGVVYALLATPDLPRLGVMRPAAGAAGESPIAAQTGPADRTSPAQPVSLDVNRRVSPTAPRALRFAFYEDAPGAFPSLRLHAADLDAIVTRWLSVTSENGAARVKAVERVNIDRVARWLRSNTPTLAIYPEISSGLEESETLAMLASPTSRSRIIAGISDYLEENDFPGVAVRLVAVPPAGNRAIFVKFLWELAACLRARHRKLITETNVAASTRSIREIREPSDYVILRAHDDSSGRGPGSIAAQSWYEERLAAHLVNNDPGKIIVSVGAGGYDWDEFEGRKEISTPSAWAVLDRYHAALQFDGRSLNPHFDYRDLKGHRHEVWFLDASTAFNQLKAALPYRPAGVALYQMGVEDPGIWSFWARTRLPDATALASLATMQPGHDLYAGLKASLVSATPGVTGERILTYNQKLGLVVAQSITRVPVQAFVTALSPVDPKLIALTFDDGPSDLHTARILGILAAKHAKATFYIVGRNAFRLPGFLRRMYLEGHDIGNHTFSHPDLAETGSPERIALELNATQRILESETGARTTLFRPSKAFESLTYLDEAPQIIETATRLGYYTAPLDVDSFDWKLAGSSAAEKARVVDRLVSVIAEGDRQIVLMHDGGGDRQTTIDILPDIIDRLQARGFRFVTTHELVGKSRDEMMPPVRGQSLVVTAAVGAGGAGLQTLAWIGDSIPMVAISASILAILRLTLIIIGATWHKVRQGTHNRCRRDTDPPRRIAILVPAYNEETVIAKTIRTLLGSTTADPIQIIVIDDGSSDRTAEVVRSEFADVDLVRLCSRPNGGKASALNYGIRQTDADIIVAIDGDTVLLPDAIEHLVRPFADPSVGAVAGTVYVGNRKNLITRFQALEYTMSQHLDRRAFGHFNAIGVVPGAIGAWRRQAVLEAGGYSHDTLAEDADLTVSLERRGWKVAYEPRALALTEAPESLRGFLKQRFRWMFGTLQVAYKHSDTVSARPTGVSMITIPNIFLFQFAFTLLAPLMDALLIWTLSLEVLNCFFAPGAAADGRQTLSMLAGYWLLFQTFDLLAGAAALTLNGIPSDWKLMPLLVIQRFCYRQLLYFVALKTMLTAVKGRLVGWGKLVRTGSVPFPPGGCAIPKP